MSQYDVCQDIYECGRVGPMADRVGSNTSELVDFVSPKALRNPVCLPGTCTVHTLKEMTSLLIVKLHLKTITLHY